MRQITTWLVLCSVSIAFQGSLCDEASRRSRAMKDLYQRLFPSHHKHRQFLPTTEKPIEVNFYFKIINIKEVNAKTQTITVYGWVYQEWYSPLLRWNSSQFDGITELMVDPSHIWVPDILLYNNIDTQDHSAGSRETYKTDVNIYHSGLSIWRSPAIFESLCEIDVTFFPFDAQTCNLKFGSWSLTSNKLKMRIQGTSTFGTNFYVKNGEWILLNEFEHKHNEVRYPCCPVCYYDDITVTIHIARQYFNYLVNNIIPCAMISSTILFGFIVPPESGERIGLGMTVLFAMTVFQQLTMTIFPSFGFPLLGLYYLATSVEISAAVIAVTIVITISANRNQKLPHWTKRLVIDWMSTIVFLRDKVEKSRPKSRQVNLATQLEDRETESKVRRKRQGDERRGYENDEDSFYIHNVSNESFRHAVRTQNVSSHEDEQRHRNNNDVTTNAQLTKIPDEKGLESTDYELATCQWERKMSARILDRFFLGISIITVVTTGLCVFLAAPQFMNRIHVQ